MDKQTTIHELKEKIKQFCDEREWDKYHNAKDLAIGIITEASELLEHFRFRESEIIDKKREQICEELSDVLYFVLRLAQKYDIDLTTELNKKMVKNTEKYPVEECLKKEYKKYNER
ncbi:nucleotide pyrophosphohydrolase [Candidatus Woesearchaeota archaeon]|nr:nucleotide pyrophosphohydrolase [Candidatus Woesearchaeota archaeon]MBW3016219.1 nucleotide pyrophosphohydrolase [Candidatus Woesearchaeota archaeon]